MGIMRVLTFLLLLTLRDVAASALDVSWIQAYASLSNDGQQQQQQQQHILGRPPPSPSPSPSTLPFPHKPHRAPAGFISLGDSYSAGIGAGTNTSDDDCRLGQSSYPMLLNADLEAQEGPDATTFQHLSCTGSRLDDVLAGSAESQIDRFNTTSTADFALFSIGGNDLGFFEIMNSCIFRFYSFYSGTCESAMRNSERQIAGPDFEYKLRIAIMEVLDRVHWEKRPWFTITVTGYARFFNDETDICDDCSLGIWWRGPKLKKELRQRMNKMVIGVNAKIKRSVDAINARFTTPRVLFLNYDDAFDGHRFCEPGVIEPDYKRNETWFFHVGGRDNVGNSTDEPPRPPPPPPGESSLPAPFSLSGGTSGEKQRLDPASPLVNPAICMDHARSRGDWGELALCMMARAVRDDPTLRMMETGGRDGGGGIAPLNNMWYVPTYYGKTFHPRTLGHMAIRDRMYKLWEEVEAAR